jgi:tetratricopeptide (TPR) repeat protein
LFLPKTDRKIIPRWRDFLTTVALGQLSPALVRTAQLTLPSVDELEALAAWRRQATLWHALDLVGAAFVAGNTAHPDVISAAKFVEIQHSNCPTPANELVSRILHPENGLSGAEEPAITSEARIRRDIHAKRKRLRLEPRNAFLWTDLACLYTNLGQLEKARDAIEKACYLALDNRFVVRSAARFLIHIGDAEKALRLLRTTALNETDPWVVAAEIGVSSLSNKDPHLLKTGKRMIENRNILDFAKSELASAVATLELNEGNKRAAKKLFRQSLNLPTENSVAQAEWATEQIGDLNLQAHAESVPRNFETHFLYGYRTGDWESARIGAEKWLNDQPFSSRPAMATSHLYTAIFERYDDALEILRSSLASNPQDRGLTNNQAFALTLSGRLDEAESLLNGIDPSATKDAATITLTATKGLLMFRRGHPAIGRALYLDAISRAQQQSNDGYAASAALYLAAEELKANTETKLQTVRDALRLASKFNDAFVRYKAAALERMARLEASDDHTKQR